MPGDTTGHAEGSDPIQTNANPPQPSSAPQKPTPVEPTAPSPPAAQTSAQSTQAQVAPGASEEAIRSDIARILAEAKLPERRSVQGAADKPAPPATGASKEPAILEERIVRAANTDASAPSLSAATVMPTPGHMGAQIGAQTRGGSEPGAAAPAPEAEYPHTEHSSSLVTPLRTLKDDLQSIVRERKISLVHAVSLEEDRRARKAPLSASPERIAGNKRGARRAAGVLFASAILITLGGAAIFGVMYVVNQKAAVPATIPQSSLLFAESTVTFPLDGVSAGSLKSALALARTRQIGSLGSITRILPTLTITSSGGNASRQASLAEFFQSLGIHPPDELLHAVGPDFFFGIHTVDTNAPLFVITVTSYDHAFAGMLAWEKTINADLTPIFTAVPANKMDANGVPTARTFQDVVMRNYDARALEDDGGNIELYYSFPTPDILVIAESPYSFGEILSRLQAERKL